MVRRLKGRITQRWSPSLTSGARLTDNVRQFLSTLSDGDLFRDVEYANETAEGLLREHYVINGVPVNEIIYGILRHEIISE